MAAMNSGTSASSSSADSRPGLCQGRDDDGVYRLLQQHLDRQAVGFPASRTGADLRLLRRLFAPEEARLALHLSYHPTPQAAIAARAGGEFAPDVAARLLESMFAKGAIGWKEKEGVSHWFVMPLVVGMYEAQGGQPPPEFIADADAYMRSLSYGRAILAARPSQMRTVPVNQSIAIEHGVATYDDIRAVVRDSDGPFVVLPCICRHRKATLGEPCRRTARQETCLGFGDTAKMMLRRGHGREIARDETAAILEKNQEDGLVLQPANARKPEFVCSCCGCCCGMLGVQRLLPRPVDFWATNFCADVAEGACTGCGRCVDRCQVNAISVARAGGKARVDAGRCIGCGLCVPTCPSQAVRLRRKDAETVPPETEEALYSRVMENKQGKWAQRRTLLKAALGVKP